MAEKYPEGMIVGALPQNVARKVKTPVHSIATLTTDNLELVRSQFENNLLVDDGNILFCLL